MMFYSVYCTVAYTANNIYETIRDKG